jgi:hypothetical protein
MFENWNRKSSDSEDVHAGVISRTVLEHIIADQGGYGMTPDDAERFLAQVGADDAIFTLISLRVETFRLRMDKVLNALMRYAANPADSDVLAMAENAQVVLQEFIQLCEALGLVESHNVYVVTDEDD